MICDEGIWSTAWIMFIFPFPLLFHSSNLSCRSWWCFNLGRTQWRPLFPHIFYCAPLWDGDFINPTKDKVWNTVLSLKGQVFLVQSCSTDHLSCQHRSRIRIQKIFRIFFWLQLEEFFILVLHFLLLVSLAPFMMNSLIFIYRWTLIYGELIIALEVKDNHLFMWMWF